MHRRLQSHWFKKIRTGAALLSGLLLLCGCNTAALDSARHEFYRGNFTKAEEQIQSVENSETDRVLFLMERGTIRQAAAEYPASSTDFIEASDKLKDLETYSVSEGASSMVVNDNVQSYIGVPFERAMLHGLTALNHYALSAWENAAVESRRIIKIQSDEVRGEYPDDAFTRYIAGFGLQLMDDPSNAALQYRLAAGLLDGVAIDALGNVSYAPPADTNNSSWKPSAPPPEPSSDKKNSARLTCFIMLGRSPTGQELLNRLGQKPQAPPYVEIYHKGHYLGRSYMLSDVTRLAYITAEKESLRKAAKEAARLAMKEGAAVALEKNDQELAGALVRLILIGLLEQPDTRRWETLPNWFSVATVPCPPDLAEYDAVVKSSSGVTMQSYHVTAPITRKNKQIVSFFRDLPRSASDAYVEEKPAGK